MKKQNANEMLKRGRASLGKQAESSRAGRNIKITEVRSYVPLSHDYADLFANLVASLELCIAALEVWEIWRDQLRNENSKQLVKRMIVILSRYLGYPEGRVFSRYQQREKWKFLEMAKKPHYSSRYRSSLCE